MKKTGKLTLCDWDNKGRDIPTYDVESPKIVKQLIKHWAKNKKDSVFVCYNWYNMEFQYQVPEFHIVMDAKIFSPKKYLGDLKDKRSIYLLDFNIFEFKSWEEAFNYCLDLKEGL